MMLATCAAPVFGTTMDRGRALLKRPRGVVAVAPAACGETTVQEKLARRVVAAEPSVLRAQKRSRMNLDVKIVQEEVSAVLAPRAELLKQRMEAKLAAARGRLEVEKAALLSRDPPTGGLAPACKDFKDDDARMMATKRRQDHQSPSADKTAERRKTSSPKPAPQAAAHHQRAEARKQPTPDRHLVKPTSEAAAHHRRRTEAMKQPTPDRHLVKPAPQAAAHHHQRTEARKQPTRDQQHEKKGVHDAIDKAKEALERRRLEQIARERERFRQELLEVEKAAMPDETVSAEDMEELGITAIQYDVTRTRKQALATRRSV
jgi:hypothetical protein